MYTPYQAVTDEQLQAAGMIFAVYPAPATGADDSGHRVILFDTRVPKGVPASQLKTVRMLGITLDPRQVDRQLSLLRRRIGRVKPPPE